MVKRHPVPPKESMVKAFDTIDLPCSGAGPTTGFSTSICKFGMFGELTLLPSIFTPLPPKKDINEQFCTYGDVTIVGYVSGRYVYPDLLTVISEGSSYATA